jgi:hypothetical protein
MAENHGVVNCAFGASLYFRQNLSTHKINQQGSYKLRSQFGKINWTQEYIYRQTVMYP